MSSFQSFKSFVKLETNNNPTPENDPFLEKKQNFEPHLINDPILKNTNQQQSQSNQQKVAKRVKKLGSICNFILKVYTMLEQKEISNIVSWSEKDTSLSSKNFGSDYKNQIRPQNCANSFQILDFQKFQEIVLPKYFKHSNMSSFVRQLNMYGFHKLRGDKGNYEFQHQKFNKNSKQLLSEIRRKNPEFGVMSSTNLEDNSQMSLRNLKSIQDKIGYLAQHRPVTQQQLFSLRQECIDNSIFPPELYLLQKKISLEIQEENESEGSYQKEKAKKIQFIEEENNRLRKIKLSKLQKIKELNSINKQEMQMKFSKVMFSFFALKLSQELKSKGEKSFQQKQKSFLSTSQNLKKIVNHIIQNQPAEGFQFYTKSIKNLMKENIKQNENEN